MVHLTAIGSAMWTLHTRKGSSDQARAAMEYISSLEEAEYDKYEKFFEDSVKHGMTPTFEYTAPDNQIVLRYEKPELRLLAVRHNITGVYQDYEKIAKEYGLPRALQVQEAYGHELKDFVDAQKDFEGVVIRVGDEFAKIKNAEYLLKHKALDKMRFEKDVIEVCLLGLIDDILPIIDGNLKDKLLKYNDGIQSAVISYHFEIHETVMLAIYKHDNRKDMAMYIKHKVDKPFQGVAFKLLDSLSNTDGYYALTECVKQCIIQNTSTATKVEAQRDKMLQGIDKW
jgi:RNA ligase